MDRLSGFLLRTLASAYRKLIGGNVIPLRDSIGCFTRVGIAIACRLLVGLSEEVVVSVI